MKAWLMVALAGVLLLVEFSASADEPIELTASQLDTVTAGTGRDNLAPHVWEILGPGGLGFYPTHNAAADSGVIDQAGFIGVLIPRKSSAAGMDCSAFMAGTGPCFFTPGT
jgi:hypothetical protein